jgi:tRNA A37 threonylcarbamoyladenosine synthetase subunit TsaC/SUA5/YrdC
MIEPQTSHDSAHAELEDRAYAILHAGGLVLLQTDVGYGLVAMRDRAVQRIYELKGRPSSKPCVTLADASIIDDLVTRTDRRVLAWVDRTSRRTPIAVIAPLNPASRLLAGLSPYMRGQTTTLGTIATFYSAGPRVMRLAARAWADGMVLVGSSANSSGTGNNYALADVPEAMRAGADLVIDDGRARYHQPDGMATTMLDLTKGTFQRKGIHYEQIEAAWRSFCREVADGAGRGQPAVAMA